MAKFISFRAWRYNPERVELAKVVAPPYDVIPPKQQQALYKRDPANIIRVELPKDSPKQDKYQQAAQYWQQWIKRGIVKQDEKPGFYLYETIFKELEGKREHRRLVVFGLLQLEPFETRTVLPHEKTHAKPKADRLKLLSATHTTFSPVFGLYEDNQQVVQALYKLLSGEKPITGLTMDDGEKHTIWHITDSASVQKISAMLEKQSILIADGHHRYETALDYSQNHSGEAKRPSTAYTLMGLSEYRDPGILVYPIHRLIQNLESFDLNELIKKLSNDFYIESIERNQLERIASGSDAKGFGLLSQQGSYRLSVKDLHQAYGQMPAGKLEIWYQLPVTQLSHLVLKHLGVNEGNMERHVLYKRSLKEATERVTRGESDLVFVMSPVPIKAMREICMAGELMPQKSTYFYPKLGSGFLMHQHE